MNLELKAKWLRKEILKLAFESHNQHIAPAMSIVEILIAIYYEILTPDDKFILSKGHGCLALFPILRDKGFNPTISGHPDIQPDQGIECTTGSLGHGLPIAIGFALAKKIKKEPGRIYVLMGDGECQEGTTWESLLLCKKLKLDNLTIIIDRNRLQALDNTEEILPLEPLRAKIFSFVGSSWETDGHNLDYLCTELKMTKKIYPTAIIVNTIKGKGLSFAEGASMWHNRMPNKDELKQAYEELE